MGIINSFKVNDYFYKHFVIEYNRGMVSDSLKYFEKVLKINSTNTSAIIFILFIYRQKGRFDAADLSKVKPIA